MTSSEIVDKFKVNVKPTLKMFECPSSRAAMVRFIVFNRTRIYVRWSWVHMGKGFCCE